MTLALQNKNNVPTSQVSKDTGLTWDQDATTWDNSTGTWNVPGVQIATQAKNNVSLTTTPR